jgi:hypothetical protein
VVRRFDSGGEVACYWGVRVPPKKKASAAKLRSWRTSILCSRIIPLGLRRLWRWRDDNYNVLEDGVVVGRIFLSPAAPEHRPWMWTSNEHQGRPPAFGYEATWEAAMAAFAKFWRRD